MSAANGKVKADEKPGESPVFDLTKMGHRHDQQLARAQRRYQRHTLKLMQANNDLKISDDEIEAMEDENDRIADEMMKLMMRVVVSLPKRYLVPDAPDVDDWSDPENFQYIASYAHTMLTKDLQEYQISLIQRAKN